MARRATSLGPKPSLFGFLCLFFCFLIPFLSLLFNTKNLVFPREKGILFIFSVSPSFSLSLFWPPSFSVSLSLSLSSLLFFLWQLFSSSIVSLFFWFPVLFFLSNPFFLSLLFPDFKLCFLFNINVFGFKTNNLTKQTFLVKNRYFSTFLKAKNCKKKAILMVTNWATLMVTNWATFVPL